MSSHVLSRLVISCHVLSCHVMSCHVLSCHVMLCHVMSCHVMSCHVMSSHVFSRLVISCHVMSCHVLSCHVMSCHVMSCHVISRLLASGHIMSCHVTSCHVMSCHVMSCHVMSCHVMSCHLTSSRVLSYHVMSCHVLSCHVILLENLAPESFFFYYGGGVATTRFSKPWPCAGIRLAATLSLWRRVHCERARVAPCAFLSRSRGRLRGSGVLEVCREHAAGVSRRCAVGIVFRACFVHAWPTCVSRGRLRGSCVLGGVPRACRGCVGGAVPWGLGSGRVARTHDFTHCDLRFAWQVWDFGCIDALGKALDGGSAWQAVSRARSLKSLDFVALCDKSRVRARVGRCEIVAGAGNLWICGCELGADFSGNAAAGCVGRVGHAALCRGTQWQAVTMGVGCVARVARAALCHGDCCWACHLGAAALCHWDW